MDKGYVKVIRGWRKLHNEELHNLHSSPSTIRMVKSRMMRWTRYVAHTGRKRNAYKYGYRYGKARRKDTTTKAKT
jgi:hypothetical protein